MQILSSFTLPCVVPNLYNFLVTLYFKVIVTHHYIYLVIKVNDA